MKLKSVSFKLAQELKKVKFDIPVFGFWKNCGKGLGIIECETGMEDSCEFYEILRNYNNKKDNVWSAPTLELAKMWFREKHDIEIIPTFVYSNKWKYEIAYINFSYHKNHVKVVTTTDWGNLLLKTYEETLERALLEACKLIKI